MNQDYTKVFTESRIIVARLATLLNEAGIKTLVKSDTLPGYEISNFFDELFVHADDIVKAQPIIDEFKKEINQ